MNERRKARGPFWQDESLDRIVRDEAELLEKWNYIIDNAGRAGLAERSEDYPYLFT